MINPQDEITEADVVRVDGALGQLLDLVRRRVPSVLEPAWRAMSKDEATTTAKLACTDGSLWGADPVSTVRTVASMLIDAIVQNVNAFHVQLRARAISPLAIDPQVRTALEAASQAWWLLDETIKGRTRVARLYVLRRSSAEALKTTVGHMDLGLPGPYGSEVAHLEDYYEGKLALARTPGPNGEWGCEQQMKIGYTRRAAQYVGEIGHNPAAGPYAFYSGAAHAELWRIQHGYREVKRPDGTVVLDPYIPVVWLNAAASVCIDSMMYPLARAFVYAGRGASWKDLEAQVAPLREAMTLN